MLRRKYLANQRKKRVIVSAWTISPKSNLLQMQLLIQTDKLCQSKIYKTSNKQNQVCSSRHLHIKIGLLMLHWSIHEFNSGYRKWKCQKARKPHHQVELIKTSKERLFKIIQSILTSNCSKSWKSKVTQRQKLRM